MNPDPNNKENQNTDHNPSEKHLEALRIALEAAEKKAKSFESDWSALFDQNKKLRDENHRIQQGYENLRIQKGGFGFKMLMLSGFGGFVTALLLCFVYLKLKPKPDYVQTFTEFRREKLFEFEFDLSRGNFEKVEASLLECVKNEDYKAIQAEIQFTQKIVGAAKRYCQQEE